MYSRCCTTLDEKSVKTCLVIEKCMMHRKFNILGEFPSCSVNVQVLFFTKLLLHHDKARPHTTAKAILQYLAAKKIKVYPHPPYSPDVAPCDFRLFPKLKEQLRNQMFFTRLCSRRVVMCLVVVYIRSFVRSFPHRITSI